VASELPVVVIDVDAIDRALCDGTLLSLSEDADGDRLTALPWGTGGAGIAACIVSALPEDEQTTPTAGQLRELILAHDEQARAAAAAVDDDTYCLVVRRQPASGPEERFVKTNEARRTGCEFAVGHGREYIAWMFGRGSERPQIPLQIVVMDSLSDRDPGDRAILAGKHVLIIGLGSFGGMIAADLARAGVRRFTLADGERLEAGNVVRHVAGLSQVGQRKTRIGRRVVHEFAPDATVDLIESALSAATRDIYAEAAKAADLVICATDSRQSRMITNRMACEAGVTALFGGVSTGAYSGMVLRARPGDPCYNCFALQFPASAADRETHESAYSATPDAHLALDIWPVVQMMSRIALLELVGGRTSSTLDEDLTAPWYIWVTRREIEYETFVPLGQGNDRPSALRWIPVAASKTETCSACGSAVEKT
jgi:molybdopterin/thiamine biosynthesis adenylyltransferase